MSKRISRVDKEVIMNKCPFKSTCVSPALKSPCPKHKEDCDFYKDVVWNQPVKEL